MNTKMLVHARKLWFFPGVDPSTARYNCRAWIRSVRRLGDKWVYAKTYNLQELKERRQTWTQK